MFVGHYSASFWGKAQQPRLPLWLLFIAVQFIDVLWAVFVLLGVEKARIVPGITAGSPLDLYYMPYTHSLIGALALSAVAGLLCQMVRSWRGLRPGLIVAGAVFSHWLLDLLVHRRDLSLYGDHFKMGLGLWNYLWPSFLLELVVLWLGAGLYLRQVSSKTRIVAFVLFLSAVQIFGTFFVPPPPSARAEAQMALFFYFAFAAIAGWADSGNYSRLQRSKAVAAR